MRDAFNESRELSDAVDLLVVQDEVTGRTVYVRSGRVSVYVTPDGRDVDRVTSRRVA